MSALPAGMTVKERYTKYEEDRQPYLDRARECAKRTLPMLIPPDNAGKHTEYPTPFQSLGARGINNLASKLMIALLPPNSPFFRLFMEESVLAEMEGEDPELRSKVLEALGKMERKTMKSIETSNIRPTSFISLKHLLVAGNVLLHIPSKDEMRLYPLSRFVVKRDPSGTVLETIALDVASPLTLSEEVREACQVQEPKDGKEENVEIYTYLYREGNQWKTYQEINGLPVPDSEGSYALDKCPFICLRYTKIDGENYSRSYAEELLGDLISLDDLMKAIVEGSLAAARVLFLVRPNSTTKIKTLTDAPNGAFVNGEEDHVKALQLGKFADFRTADSVIQRLEQRLSYAFLMNGAMQRDAERVTAEEIRMNAAELEDALGGLYSILSQEYQLPLVKRLMQTLQRSGDLPQLPKGAVQPAIVTGLEALGRGHDLNKLNVMLQQLSPLGPDVLMKYLNIGDYIRRVGTNLGIDMEGLIRSKEEIEAMEQQAQAQALMEQLGPEALRQGGNIAAAQSPPQEGE